MATPHAPPPLAMATLRARCEAIAGLTLTELAARLGVAPPGGRRHKGWAGALVERALGADAGNRPEPDFTRLGVELKTLPLDRRGRPAESTWVCQVPLTPGAEPRWASSSVRRKLRRVLWVPLGTDTRGERTIGLPFLWSPSAGEERALREDWEELSTLIHLGRLHELSAHCGRCLQVRPKAAHGAVLTATVDEHGEAALTLPRGYYLRASFTAAVLEAASG